MTRRPIVGVMGGGAATAADAAAAERFGALAAAEGWIVLTGGRDAGVMAAASRGAKRAGGLVVGVLPFASADEGRVSPDVDVAIFTGMGDARNAVNALSSDVVVAFAGGPGTASEIALALKSGKPVVLEGFDDRGLFSNGRERDLVSVATTPDEAVALVKARLSESR